MSVDVVIPDSADAAADAFGDGSDVTVLAGGTIVMQMLNYWRIQPSKVLMLHDAGLTYVNNGGATTTIGATTPLSEIVGVASPLGPCAANVGDREIRSQATIGGNICAGPAPEHPVGDLQGPLLALDATVRSAGSGGERSEPISEFLTDRAGRLVLDVSFDAPAAGAFAAFRRPHAHHFTPIAVSGVTTADGDVRLAVTGAGPVAVRLPSAEAAAGDSEAAGAAALSDVSLEDDAILSAWYRGRVLPVLVQQVLDEMGGGA